MLGYLWGGMLLAGIAYAAFAGSLGGVTGLALESCKSAVSLALTMAGVVAMWSGLMRIGERSGLIEGLARGLEGPLTMLFPRVTKQSKKLIATNFIANILGLGWAATPAGLSAMAELQKSNSVKDRATDEMCLFMVVNISSLQLVSVNLLAYRQEYGSANPGEIIGPGIAVTCATTLVGIVVCKLSERLTQ